MRTLILTGLFSVLHILCSPSAMAAISGSDDFDDNVKDEEKWSLDRTSGSGVLTETGQHLEYTSGSTSPSQYSYRPWKLNKATYDTNWEVVLDLTNGANPPAGRSTSIGIEIFAAFSSFNKSIYMELYSEKEGTSAVARGFDSSMVDGDIYSGTATSATALTSGSIRLAFNAVNKVLTLYRDADGPIGGYTWTKHASYGIAGTTAGTSASANWGLAGSDELMVNIYGYSDQHTVGSGLVFADNFSAVSGTSVTTGSPTAMTNDTATLNATVFPNGMDTSVIFQIATDEDFLESEITPPQVVPGTSSSTAISAVAGDLAPRTMYWVRAIATNAAGTFTGNTVIFTAPPYTLTVDPTIGSVNASPIAEYYPAGTNVTLTATPPAGSAFVSWTGDVTGTQNPITFVMNSNKHAKANFTLPVAQAANSNLTFTTGGSKPWFGQTAVSHDGFDSVQSGAIADNESSWFQTVVNGAGQITFWLKVSSETDDVFEFFIDNVRQSDSIGGTLDWQKRTYNLGTGTHTLRWQYRKDFFLLGGADAAWVDEITFTPILDFNAWRAANFTSSELAQTAVSGANADPDADGVSNLIEFALGGQPKDGTSRILPDIHVETVGSEKYLTLTLTKPAGLSGITYTPQVCGDLSTWLGGNPNVIIMTDTSTTLKVRDSIPMGSGTNRFIRLLVGSN